MSQCPALPQKNRCWEVAYVWLKTPSSAVSLPIITALINESFPLEDKCWGADHTIMSTRSSGNIPVVSAFGNESILERNSQECGFINKQAEK